MRRVDIVPLTVVYAADGVRAPGKQSVRGRPCVVLTTEGDWRFVPGGPGLARVERAAGMQKGFLPSVGIVGQHTEENIARLPEVAHLAWELIRHGHQPEVPLGFGVNVRRPASLLETWETYLPKLRAHEEAEAAKKAEVLARKQEQLDARDRLTMFLGAENMPRNHFYGGHDAPLMSYVELEKILNYAIDRTLLTERAPGS